MNQIELDFMKGMISILNDVSEEYNNTGKLIITEEQYIARFEDLKQLEEETGIVFANSPTLKINDYVGKINYLVYNQETDSSKFEKIKEFGAKVISEEELIKILN